MELLRRSIDESEWASCPVPSARELPVAPVEGFARPGWDAPGGTSGTVYRRASRKSGNAVLARPSSYSACSRKAETNVGTGGPEKPAGAGWVPREGGCSDALGGDTGAGSPGMRHG